MKPNASQVAVRYLPFLAVAAILCLLVVITPSKGPGNGQGVSAGDFSGEGASDDFSGGGGDGGGDVQLDADGNPIGGDSGTSGDNGGSGGNSSSGGSGGSGGGNGGSGPTASASCQGPGKTPYDLGVLCKQFSGDNGGAVDGMPGYTGTEIRYTWFQPPSNAVVDGILAGAGYAREIPKFCDTMLAFEKSAQKYFQMYGRKLVPVEGSGNNAGSRGCSGKYKFWQSTCPSGTPDVACYRSEARTIAQTLKPAFVLNPRGLAALHEEFAKFKIYDIGYGGDRVRFQQFAPYLWGVGFGMERLAELHSEYYCKRLVGRGPEFAGDDVKNNPIFKERQAALIYPENGDGALKSTVDIWLKTVRGCGDTDAKAYSYQSDVTRAQQQASNTVAQLRADKVTTVGFCCDPVSMLFFLQAMEQSEYHPEHLVFPASSIASDVVGQLAGTFQVADQWKHAFGISNYPINQPDATSEFRKAYADGGGPGGMPGAAAIEVESWGVFKHMLQMIHMGGAQPTPRSMFQGMQDLPSIAPAKRTPGSDFAPPDPFTPLRDVAEVWWNPNLRSYYNNTNGAMCYVNEGARYDVGRIPGGPPKLFTGACARLEEYE